MCKQFLNVCFIKLNLWQRILDFVTKDHWWQHSYFIAIGIFGGKAKDLGNKIWNLSPNFYRNRDLSGNFATKQNHQERVFSTKYWVMATILCVRKTQISCRRINAPSNFCSMKGLGLVCYISYKLTSKTYWDNPYYRVWL